MLLMKKIPKYKILYKFFKVAVVYHLFYLGYEIIAFFLYLKNKNIVVGLKEMNEPIYQFLVKKWYFDEIYDYLFVNPSKRAGKFLWKKVDGSIIDKFGPDGISSIIKNLSIKAVRELLVAATKIDKDLAN